MKNLFIALAVLINVGTAKSQALYESLLLLNPPSAPYQANATTFNGTDTTFSRTSDLSGNADSKMVTVSFWVKFSAAAGANLLRNQIWSSTESGTGYFMVNRLEVAFGGVFQVFARNTSGTSILDIRSTSAHTNANTWIHVMISVDLSNTGKRHLYVDGVDELAVSTYTDDTIDFTRPNHYVGSDGGTAQWLNGCLSEVYIAQGQYIDLSSSGNRLKFRSAGGLPVDLGATGSVPTGVAPLVYLPNPHGTFEVNAAGAGNFTRNGTIASCTAP